MKTSICVSIFSSLALLGSQHVLAGPVRRQTPYVTYSLVTDFSKAPLPSTPIGGAGDFVSIDQTSQIFKIDGKTQYFAGANAWYLSYTEDNKDVDRLLKEMKESGLLAARVWGFGNTNDASTAVAHFFQELKDGKQALNFDNNTGIPKLDYLVSQAESQGIKLILPLLNALDDLGGINTYIAAFGGSKTSFYTDTASQDAYLAYVDFIVNRYKNSPAIFSWEICNEPRCKDCETSVITNWATTVSSHIKNTDPKHLVSLGDEGWFAPPFPVPSGANTYPYQGKEGINFTANLAIKDIDYATFHMYPVQFSEFDDWGNTYIKEHADAAKTAGKPVILEEYGKNATSDQVAVYQGWQKTILDGGGIAGDLFWQWNDTLSKGAKPVNDGYGIRYDTTEGSVFDQVVVKHANAMSGKVVGGS